MPLLDHDHVGILSASMCFPVKIFTTEEIANQSNVEIMVIAARAGYVGGTYFIRWD